MLQVALFEPEIPPNAGNIIRLCANTGVLLHLIHPLGFSLSDKHLKRAGLDYHEWASIQEHANFDAFLAAVTPHRIVACSTKAKLSYTDQHFEPNDILLFGPESRGLPAEIIESWDPNRLLRIPMKAHSRSLNLSNAVAVIVYEALRQFNFEGLA